MIVEQTPLRPPTPNWPQPVSPLPLPALSEPPFPNADERNFERNTVLPLAGWPRVVPGL